MCVCLLWHLPCGLLFFLWFCHDDFWGSFPHRFLTRHGISCSRQEILGRKETMQPFFEKEEGQLLWE